MNCNNCTTSVSMLLETRPFYGHTSFQLITFLNFLHETSFQPTDARGTVENYSQEETEELFWKISRILSVSSVQFEEHEWLCDEYAINWSASFFSVFAINNSSTNLTSSRDSYSIRLCTIGYRSSHTPKKRCLCQSIYYAWSLIHPSVKHFAETKKRKKSIAKHEYCDTAD